MIPVAGPVCDYDIAILGGGLAGLSLAVRLAEPRFAGLRVLVAEARHTYRRDRTWSYWTMPRPHPFGAAVAQSWDRWAVRAGDRQVVRDAAKVRYEAIPADLLYELAVRRIREAPWIDLRQGVQVDAAEGDGVVHLRVDGQALDAGLAFDTRPDPALGRHGLSQRFLGQEVMTAAPVFKPGTAVLMDFDGDAGTGVHFTYVLPWSPHHALVEDTWFVPPGVQCPDHRAAVRQYMARRYGVTRYETGFEETGALPMDPVFQPVTRPGARLLPLGAPAGAGRPSTGYAFNAVQAQCDAVVDALVRGAIPGPVVRRPVMTRFMDATLLAMLERRPQMAAGLFAGLFARSPAGALVRFLNDGASAMDLAAVGMAMPIGAAALGGMRHVLGRVGA